MRHMTLTPDRTRLHTKFSIETTEFLHLWTDVALNIQNNEQNKKFLTLSGMRRRILPFDIKTLVYIMLKFNVHIEYRCWNGYVCGFLIWKFLAGWVDWLTTSFIHTFSWKKGIRDRNRSEKRWNGVYHRYLNTLLNPHLFLSPKRFRNKAKLE